MKLKVAIVCPYVGKVERGAENLAYYLKQKLPFEVVVFSGFDSSWTYKIHYTSFKIWHKLMMLSRKIGFYRVLYQVEKIVYYFDIFSPEFFDMISFAKKFCLEIKKYNPDCIINIGGSTIGFFLKMYRKLNKIPFISVFMAGKNLTEIKNARTQPDFYVTLTPSATCFIKTKVKKVNVELIPLGVDLQYYNTVSSLNYNELKNIAKIYSKETRISRPVVLSTSALEPQKRLDFLIKAVKRMQQGILIFAGDGSHKRYLLSLAGSLLKNRFIYLGVVDKKLLPRVYKTCDVFCLPSINEPFGNVFVEAMAANKPVVADDDEDRRWIVGNAGVLTDVRDVDKIAEALWKAYNTDWKDIPKQQAKKFSWDTIIKQYENLIIKLTRGGQFQCQL
ncbi:MAG: glycosyltransferase [Elusimicrobiota bacterium]|nr:glycosyltransferase [Endomicrobiia bacterium]MDW8166474.1 glycosyltransferase [Elusimicrobiota bacterium]